MGRLVRRFILLTLAVAYFSAAAFAQGWQHLGKVQHVEKLSDGIELTAGAAKVRITSFRPGVLRVRLAPQGSFAKDYSWAIIQPAEPGPFTVTEEQAEIRVAAGDVTVLINKDP